ncbi:hypothetical protein N665_1347s0011 [Sinapis alba]|nr:hypothetical protein N665_1347s0011 [Sinapis alba]
MPLRTKGEEDDGIICAKGKFSHGLMSLVLVKSRKEKGKIQRFWYILIDIITDLLEAHNTLVDVVDNSRRNSFFLYILLRLAMQEISSWRTVMSFHMQLSVIPRHKDKDVDK